MVRFEPFHHWRKHLQRVHERPARLLADWCGRQAIRQHLQPHIGFFKTIIDNMLDERPLIGGQEKLAAWIEKVCVDIYFSGDYPLPHISQAWIDSCSYVRELDRLYCKLVVLAVVRRKTVFSELKTLKRIDTIDGEIESVLGDIHLAQNALDTIEMMRRPLPRGILNAKAD